MKILVTGAGGQLGTDVVAQLATSGHEVVASHTTDADFRYPEQVRQLVAAHKAAWTINCAAYTAVDAAEQDRGNAFLINRDSAEAVAEGVATHGGRLVHISTDFVFDGGQGKPYSEDSECHPLGVYGQSKWEGEQRVQDACETAVILRTAWVYGQHGNNFAKTMLRLGAERDELRVVDDQIGTPSWTQDIASTIEALIRNDARGVFHFTNEGVASWYDFAHEIISHARHLGFPVKVRDVLPISSTQYPTPAARPTYSVLSKQKIRDILGGPIPHWRDSLHKMLSEAKK